MSRFGYVLDRLAAADFTHTPFRHLYVPDLLAPEDFAELVRSPQIGVAPAEDDQDLVAKLYALSYKEIVFPGTTTDVPAYLQWHADRASNKNLNLNICEGFGLTLRLQTPAPGSIVEELHDVFKSTDFWEVLARKFGLNLAELRIDAGLQKYLDGYEISPHPDIRLKALTFMLNLNPAPNSETLDYHTQYMRFTKERDYVRRFWDENPDYDRCWVPWSWCKAESRQTRNNSMVVFSPANDTIHAVRASYDHLATQRTQFYGNLWRRQKTTKRSGYWNQLKDPANLPVLENA